MLSVEDVPTKNEPPEDTILPEYLMMLDPLAIVNVFATPLFALMVTLPPFIVKVPDIVALTFETVAVPYVSRFVILLA